MQTRSRHHAPPLSTAQIGDLARIIDATCPTAPSEYRIHPDDWDEIRRLLPPERPRAQPSEFATLFIGTPNSELVALRIVLDIDAPRLPRLGARS